MIQSRSYLALLLFILIVAGVSFFGAQFRPGEWYAHLIRPSWTPPNWLFPIVWSVLYLMIAIAGWLIFQGTSRVMKVTWIIQLVLNGLWSWLFFGLHLVGVAMIDITAMFLCILLLVWMGWRTAKPVFWLLAPYLFWVGYASTLNGAIYFLNAN